ncbi:MAG: NCS2 family permease [Clostridiales bacterium]|nr:NCS2 family permease [Clostridiales bacterium]
MLERFFKLKANNTTVKVEVLAGITTFMTMAYIIALNPNLLTGFGAGGATCPTDGTGGLWNAVFLATVLSSAAGTLIMALLANKPFALAPGMGLNSYFASVVVAICSAAGYTSYEKGFGAALSIILISGILFTILTLLKVREKIVDAIPLAVRLGIPAGIGMMLIHIGLTTNWSIYDDKGNLYTMLDTFFNAGPSDTKKAMGPELYKLMVIGVIATFVGIIVIAALSHKKIKASILLGMIASTIIYWAGEFIFLDVNPFDALKGRTWLPPFKDMAHYTLFKFDFSGLFEIGVFSAVMTIITFCMVDMFDTIGTLYGTAKKANMLDESGNMPGMNKAMLSDSLATCVGACTGTSTVTTFIESASGVEAGGRTGLTSLVTGLLFLACMFIAPIAGIIPAPATSAALVYVGFLMISSLKEVDYSDMASAAPVALLLMFMTITGSVGNGIGIGLISYSLIKLFTGRGKEVSVLTYVLAVLFIAKFFITF